MSFSAIPDKIHRLIDSDFLSLSLLGILRLSDPPFLPSWPQSVPPFLRVPSPSASKGFFVNSFTTPKNFLNRTFFSFVALLRRRTLAWFVFSILEIRGFRRLFFFVEFPVLLGL